MSIMDTIKRIKAEAERRKAEEDALPDEQTRDKYLRSLRRMRRTQLEENEKIKLKKQIDQFNKQRSMNFMFGISKTPNGRKVMVKKRKGKQHSFLGKGML